MPPKIDHQPMKPGGAGPWLVGLLALTGLISVGCASTPITAADYAKDRLEALIDQHKTATSFQVRLNPATCECPPFEISLGDAWHRSFLEPPDETGPVGRLRNRLLEAESQGLVARARVIGVLSGSVRLAPNRMPCPVLKVTGLCEDDRCPNDEDLK